MVSCGIELHRSLYCFNLSLLIIIIKKLCFNVQVNRFKRFCTANFKMHMKPRII